MRTPSPRRMWPEYPHHALPPACSKVPRWTCTPLPVVSRDGDFTTTPKEIRLPLDNAASRYQPVSSDRRSTSRVIREVACTLDILLFMQPLHRESPSTRQRLAWSPPPAQTTLGMRLWKVLPGRHV